MLARMEDLAFTLHSIYRIYKKNPDIYGERPLAFVGKSVSKKLTFEHWTPISFFRDIFDFQQDISVEDISAVLKQNYRRVWITKEEDKRLDKKSRAFRTVSDYAKHNIYIKEKTRWDCLMRLAKQPA